VICCNDCSYIYSWFLTLLEIFGLVLYCFCRYLLELSVLASVSNWGQDFISFWLGTLVLRLEFEDKQSLDRLVRIRIQWWQQSCRIFIGLGFKEISLKMLDCLEMCIDFIGLSRNHWLYLYNGLDNYGILSNGTGVKQSWMFIIFCNCLTY